MTLGSCNRNPTEIVAFSPHPNRLNIREFGPVTPEGATIRPVAQPIGNEGDLSGEYRCVAISDADLVVPAGPGRTRFSTLTPIREPGAALFVRLFLAIVRVAEVPR